MSDLVAAAWHGWGQTVRLSRTEWLSDRRTVQQNCADSRAGTQDRQGSSFVYSWWQAVVRLSDSTMDGHCFTPNHQDVMQVSIHLAVLGSNYGPALCLLYWRLESIQARVWPPGAGT